MTRGVQIKIFHFKSNQIKFVSSKEIFKLNQIKFTHTGLTPNQIKFLYAKNISIQIKSNLFDIKITYLISNQIKSRSF